MSIDIAVAALASLLVSALITGVARKVALTRGVVDVPNHRSSHTIPTPRGGGIAIVLTTSTAFALFGLLGVLPSATLIALTGGGLAVACVGFADDFGRASVAVRLLVHAAAAAWGIFWLGGLPPLHVGSQVYHLGLAGDVLGALAIVWVLNLFNFMDGIDGLAASEAVFVAWGGAWLAIIAGISGGVPAASMTVGAASFGFAIWNWPPAKVFMGDVGSGYLGYVIAVLALAAGHAEPVALPAWLILGAAFFVDATLTLLRRLARGHRVYVPHRSHAYQALARRWGNHRRVTLIFIAINLVWLMPAALTAIRFPALAYRILLVAAAPLILLAWLAGAGRQEPA